MVRRGLGANENNIVIMCHESPIRSALIHCRIRVAFIFPVFPFIAIWSRFEYQHAKQKQKVDNKSIHFETDIAAA